MPRQGKSIRGFAAMDESKQRSIASKGGKAAHQSGTAHEFTAAEAREAGRKGGESVSADREHMAEIGREGGLKSGSMRRGRAQRVRTRTARARARTHRREHHNRSGH